MRYIQNMLKYLLIIILAALGGCINLPESCIPPLTYDLVEKARAKISSTNSVTLNANGHYINDYEQYSIVDPITNEARSVKLPSPDLSKYGKWFDSGVNVIADTNITIKSIEGLYYVGDSLCVTPQIQQLPDNSYYIDYQKLQNDGYSNFINNDIINPCPTITSVKKGSLNTINTGINIQTGDVIEITAFTLGSSLKDPGSNTKVVISDSALDDAAFAQKIQTNPSSLIGISLTLEEIQRLQDLYAQSDEQKKRELKYLLSYLSKLKVMVGSTSFKAYLFSGLFASPNLNSIISAPYNFPRNIRIFNSRGPLSFSFDPIDQNLFNNDATFGGFFFKIKRGEVFNGQSSSSAGPVEMVLVTCSQSANGGCDPNINPDSILSNSKISPGSIVQSTENARLWFRVADTNNSAYYNNIGTVNVTWESLKFAAPVADIYMSVVKLMMKYTDIVSKAIYNNLIKETGLYKIIQIMCLLYVVTSAFMYITGFAKYESMELVSSALKLGIVATLISPDSFEFFNEKVFGLIKALPSFLIQNLSDPYASSDAKDNPFYFMDDSLTLIFNPEVLQRVFMLVLMPGGILILIAFIYIIFCVLKTFIRVLLSYIISMFMVGLLLSATPIFLPFVLYKYQLFKDTFEKWINMMLRYSIEPALLIVGLAIISKIMFSLMVSSFPSLYMCLKCMLPIDLTKIPILGSFLDHALCISGYLPWGVEYGAVDPNAGPRVAMIFMQLFVTATTLALLAIIYSKYPDYVSDMTTQLTTIYNTGGLGAFKGGDGKPDPAEVLNGLMVKVTKGTVKLGVSGFKKLGGLIADKVMRDKTDSKNNDPNNPPQSNVSGPSAKGNNQPQGLLEVNKDDVEANKNALMQELNSQISTLAANPNNAQTLIAQINASDLDPADKLALLTNLRELYMNQQERELSEYNEMIKHPEQLREGELESKLEGMKGYMEDINTVNDLIKPEEQQNIDENPTNTEILEQPIDEIDKNTADNSSADENRSTVEDMIREVEKTADEINDMTSTTENLESSSDKTMDDMLAEIQKVSDEVQAITPITTENLESSSDKAMDDMLAEIQKVSDEVKAITPITKENTEVEIPRTTEEQISSMESFMKHDEPEIDKPSAIEEAEKHIIDFFSKDSLYETLDKKNPEEALSKAFEAQIEQLKSTYSWDTEKLETLLSGLESKAEDTIKARGGYNFRIRNTKKDKKGDKKDTDISIEGGDE